MRAPGISKVSQRSLHNAPIFRLLLKVAVNGTHQCDFTNFCGASGPQLLSPPPSPTSKSHAVGGGESGLILLHKEKQPCNLPGFDQRCDWQTKLIDALSLYSPETATLVYTTIAPMTIGLGNHLVDLLRQLRCTGQPHLLQMGIVRNGSLPVVPSFVGLGHTRHACAGHPSRHPEPQGVPQKSIQSSCAAHFHRKQCWAEAPCCPS